MEDSGNVEVALRVRPLLDLELNSRKITDCVGGTQVVIGKDARSFTFDYAFDDRSTQENVYEKCVRKLVTSYMNGYNATILAYGQTGSGKTYTMGTAGNHDIKSENLGIVPRVVDQIFETVEADLGKKTYTMRVQFCEIHNHDINDLLNTGHGGKPDIQIREAPNGEILLSGATEHKVYTKEDMLQCLVRGSESRTTASTKMNAVSSRSHAIFSVFLTSTKVLQEGDSDESEETISSKFHFVDLAGSERLKRTGATGQRAQEGININVGLLALGNCISALTDEKRKGGHIPFRNSKITRLLQDSLGGNSRTIMLACVSPAEINEEETLNTLKYANRARNIRNKAIINRDPQAILIDNLRTRVTVLEKALVDAGGSVEDVDASMQIQIPTSSNEAGLEEILRLERTVSDTRKQGSQLREKLVELARHATTYQERVHELLCENSDSGSSLLALLEDDEVLNENQIDASFAQSTSSKLYKKSKKTQKATLGLPDFETLDTSREETSSVTLSSPSQGSENGGNSSFHESDSDMEDEDIEQDSEVQELQAMEQNLSLQILEKEALYERLLKTKTDAQTKEKSYMTKITEMESELEKVQAEKKRVLKNKRNNSKNGDTEKAMQRYQKKISDLTARIKECRLKAKEAESLKREQARDEQRIQKLMTEIDKSKRDRVELARKIQEKAGLHRESMKAKENNIKRAVKEARKAKSEMSKIQQMYHKKATILKRETEKNAFLLKKIHNQDQKRSKARKQREEMKEQFNKMTSTPSMKRPFSSRKRSRSVNKENGTPAKKQQVSKFLTPHKASEMPPPTKIAWESKSPTSVAELEEMKKQLTKEKDSVTKLNKILTDTYSQLETSEAQNKQEVEVWQQKVNQLMDDNRILAEATAPKDNTAVNKYKTRYEKLSKKLTQLQKQESAGKSELAKLKSILEMRESESSEKQERIRHLEKMVPTEKTVMSLIQATKRLVPSIGSGSLANLSKALIGDVPGSTPNNSQKSAAQKWPAWMDPTKTGQSGSPLTNITNAPQPKSAEKISLSGLLKQYDE